MPHPLENKEIRFSDVPGPDSVWLEIRGFAGSFYGYDYFGSTGACTVFANQALRNFKENGSLPEKLSELRSCLFFEQRRVVHTACIPDENKMIYIHALLEKICKKLKSGELD